MVQTFLGDGPLNIAERARIQLFPERQEKRTFDIRYSAKFSSYNANVRYTSEKMIFSLSREWEEVSIEIQQGLIEHLLCKVYGVDKPSTNQDLYSNFMKNLSAVAPITEKNPYLLSRFYLINERYFNGLMTEPNLKWGQKAYRKLGHYEYASDTIVISSIFSSASVDTRVEELVDFVLYHEMLHKKHQYNHKTKRVMHHTPAFRADERKWHDVAIEEKIKRFLTRRKIKNLFSNW